MRIASPKNSLPSRDATPEATRLTLLPNWPVRSGLLPLLLPCLLWFLVSPATLAQVSQDPGAAAVFAAQGGNATVHLTRIYLTRQKKSLSSTLERPELRGSTTSAGAAASAAAGGGPDPQYYGGPVISNVQVVVVYWGNGVSSVATTAIPGFYSAVTNSNFMDMLSEYSTNGVTPVGGGPPGDQSIGRGTLNSVFTITPSAANSGTTVDDSQVQAELLAQIAAGKLPAPATDSTGLVTTLYMTYFPPGVTITLQGASSCVDFCAYHGAVSYNDLDVAYGVLPDMGPTSGCYTGCAEGTEFQDLATVSSHEMAEAITDTGVGLATVLGPPLAWYDVNFGETADICNASGDPANQAVLPGSGYTVQKIWSNLQQDCVSAPPTFTLSAPANVLAGTPFTVTLSVQSSTGAALSPPYEGTVEFTSSDSAAVLPPNYTFTPNDNNTHTFSNAAVLKTTGAQTITATDTHSGGFTGSAQVGVTAHTSPYFSLAVPATAVLGTPFSFTVTALAASGSLNPAYSGTVHFTSSDPQATLPPSATLANGVGTFSATLHTSGSQTIAATDTVNPAITGSSTGIAASGAATHFAVVTPASAATGFAFTFTVSALDQFNNTASTYSGTVHFTSSDAQALLPANATLTSGMGTFSATINTKGTQTLSATDTVNSTITGTSPGIATSGSATHFAVVAPGSATAGTAFTFVVTALDSSGNTAPTYSGTVAFNSSDGMAVLPVGSTLTNGTGSFSAILKTAGAQTITATDTVTNTITGVSGNISVIVVPPAAVPTFSPNPGTYNTPQTVNIADSSSGVAIYYTTNGSTPTTASNVYAGPLTISTTTTLQAIAAGPTNAPSSPAFGIYKIVALAPTFSPNPGTYNTPQTVTMADASPGVSIYYTTDGTAPTTSSAPYTAPIAISATRTLQAIASGNGYAASSAAFGIYTIAALAPSFSPNPGTYGTPQTVTITDASPGVSIYYTTNGTAPTTSSPRYTGPVTISKTTKLQAIAAGNGYSASADALGIYGIAAAAPTFAPGSGSYATPQSVAIRDASPGVTIYYTTNGSTPTAKSAKYTGPITVSTSGTVRAVAAGNGFTMSAVSSATYTIATAATPTFSPLPGTYGGPQSVTLTDSSPGVTIYYTTDGSTPTTASPKYTMPITISATTTLQAIAAGNGFPASSVGGGVYRIATAVPAFSPNPGNYNTPQTVTITDATPGVTIYYTTDGSTPTTSSSRYAGPITIATTTTLQAIAAGGGFPASSAAFGIYRITAQAPTFSPNPGNYSSPQTVTISDASPGVTIYYTTDGSTPTTSSPQYTGAVTISATTTLQAIAAGNGFAASAEDFGIYRITP
ncbi:MAG TPA: chitobiase/beta-hexosaminidase C-terminal domain-containing protein [Candidatus Sulfotelmatobacter sp.]|nr:chitobiase/beta-hexosaminidase C-terminal domain-containing protein [Candidatus Sulfotelmatobacter sp.]